MGSYLKKVFWLILPEAGRLKKVFWLIPPEAGHGHRFKSSKYGSIPPV
jgi:hypothetical protein